MGASIIAAMAVTAGVETALMWGLGYRQKPVLICFFILNLISNYAVNSLYQHVWMIAPKSVLVPLLEIGVVVFEFIGLGVVLPYRRRLFQTVCVTNLISFGLGALIVGI